MLTYAKGRLAGLGFSLTNDGAHYDGDVPMEAYLDMERFVPRAQARRDWVLSLGPPGAQYAGKGLSAAVEGFSLAEQRGLPMYDVTNEAGVQAIWKDFDDVFLPLVKFAFHPARLVGEIKEGRIIPDHGGEGDPLAAPGAVLRISRAYDIGDGEAWAVRRIRGLHAAALGDSRADIEFFAKHHGIDL